MAELKRELPTALRRLQQGNIAPVDFAQAAIGPGMAIFSKYSRVLEASGRPMSVRTALALINQTLTEVLSEQEDEFDADTRWAIAWYEQHGFEEGEFGDAELLSKAKVTSVNGLVEAGIVSSRRGMVRLLRPEELPTDWDPAEDRRLTRVGGHAPPAAGLLPREAGRPGHGRPAAAAWAPGESWPGTSPTGCSPSPRRRAGPRTPRATTPWCWAGRRSRGWHRARRRRCPLRLTWTFDGNTGIRLTCFP
ncbi:MAG: hypothetical protein KatS3mg123_1762 [Burkholderiales bacterium]|nr:MAG: hypothetical protein KatS3mg123_1762 [Burkholderiales bacterium]